MTGKVLVDITDFSVPETQLPDSDDELLYELDEALDLNVSETEEHFPEHQETEDNDEEPEDNDKEITYMQTINVKWRCSTTMPEPRTN